MAFIPGRLGKGESIESFIETFPQVSREAGVGALRYAARLAGNELAIFD